MLQHLGRALQIRQISAASERGQVLHREGQKVEVETVERGTHLQHGTGGQFGALCHWSQGCFLIVHESFPLGSVLQPLLYSDSWGWCVSQHPLLLMPLDLTASILLLSAAVGVSRQHSPLSWYHKLHPAQSNPTLWSQLCPQITGWDPLASPSQTLLKEWLNHRAHRSQPTATAPLATGKQTACRWLRHHGVIHGEAYLAIQPLLPGTNWNEALFHHIFPLMLICSSPASTAVYVQTPLRKLPLLLRPLVWGCCRNSSNEQHR